MSCDERMLFAMVEMFVVKVWRTRAEDEGGPGRVYLWEMRAV